MIRNPPNPLFWAILVTTVVGALLALDLIRREHPHGHAAAWARSTGEYDVRTIARGLTLLADGDSPAFRRIPSGVVLETSDSVITNQEGLRNLLCFYTNASSARYIPGVGLIDIWGHRMRFVVSSSTNDRDGNTRYQVTVWSNGRNGINENMKGDDISFQSAPFAAEGSPPREDK